MRGCEKRRRWCASAHAKNARERKRETASSIALRGPLWPGCSAPGPCAEEGYADAASACSVSPPPPPTRVALPWVACKRMRCLTCSTTANTRPRHHSTHAHEKHALNQGRQRIYYLPDTRQLGARARVLACTRIHTCTSQKTTCVSSRGQSPRRKDSM